MHQPKQDIIFESLNDKTLAGILNLPLPIFEQDDPYRQLRYVEHYVRDKNLAAKSVVVENHYIDRDYMEDHSVFYSKNLAPLPNFCRRVHFFRSDPDSARAALKRLLNLKSRDKFREQCDQFSKDQYLGFAVIKPLDGCPVGKTVLHLYPERSDTGLRRCFSCACDYVVHLLGVPLKISGLAFQQQDLGVSACATTALWSALQRTRAMEEGGPATPAQITIRASQYTLPFGRSMPSEGLSLDQMCQAIHSLGYAPNLIRADAASEARGVIYSAIASGVSPVLILSNSKDEWHAVAVAGIKLSADHRPFPLKDAMDDTAGDLLALYIHDDRHGPYLKAELKTVQKEIELSLSLREKGSAENWRLSHVLVPVHNKIRLSFAELRRIAFRLTAAVAAHRAAYGMSAALTLTECLIVKSHAYIESKLFGNGRLSTKLVEKFCTSLPMPRYIGVISMCSPGLDLMEVLIDTTSTERNLNFVALVQSANTGPLTQSIARSLAKIYRCPYLV